MAEQVGTMSKAQVRVLIREHTNALVGVNLLGACMSRHVFMCGLRG